MRHRAHRRRPIPVQREILHGGHALHFVRRGGGLSLSLGGDCPGAENVRLLGDADLHRAGDGGVLLYLEKGRAGLEQAGEERRLMPLTAPVTDLEQLKDRPLVAALLSWNANAVQGAKFDREELSIYIARESIREACAQLKAQGLIDFLSDVTCADFYPREPRFEMAYHLLSMKRKDRVRLKVRLDGEDAVIESITPVWPSANFFEREVFDLFGVRFLGHPYLRRIMMPEDWEGHPLRKDYPVEGYR